MLTQQHVSHITCHMSPITFFCMKKEEEEKTLKRIGQRGGASPWRVFLSTGPTPSIFFKSLLLDF